MLLAAGFLAAEVFAAVFLATVVVFLVDAAGFLAAGFLAAAFLPEIYKQMIDGTVEFLGSEKKITLAQFRDMFKTSRKYALAFLEYLDKEGITVRKDDFRILKAG